MIAHYKPKTFLCDMCGKEVQYQDRFVATAPRPSTGEVVEVMWACEVCGPKMGMTSVKEANK